jgi:hypothetical protein
MQSIGDILNIKVSYQANTWSEITDEMSIEEILNQIKSDKYKIRIEDLRNKLHKGDKEYYDNYKKQLPAITFSATFTIKRTNENLKQYNSIIVIDIDKLDSAQLELAYNNLLNDKYIISFWRSPSNQGFKGLVSIDYQFADFENQFDVIHKSAFKKLSEYFIETYKIELDKSGNDISRLCFLSYDDHLILKQKFNTFPIVKDDIVPYTKSQVVKNTKFTFENNLDALYNPQGKNNQLNRKLMSDIIRHLNNKKLSITYKYEEWCKVAMAISNTFTYEIGLNYFLKLSLLDNSKYNEVNCTNFLINCYENRKGNVNFASIIYLANQRGYKTKKQKNGVPKVEV